MPKCKPKSFFATKRPDICLSFAVHLAYRIVPGKHLGTALENSRSQSGFGRESREKNPPKDSVQVVKSEHA